MKIYILFGGTIPFGDAYPNRILSIAKGLAEHNNEVTILNFFPGKHKNDISAKPFCKYKLLNNLYYLNLSGLNRKPKSVIIQKIIGIIGLIISAFFIMLNKKPNFIIICTSNLVVSITLFLISRIKNFKIIREKNEFPIFLIQQEKYKNKLIIAKYSRYKLFDGIICMTFELEKFFKNIGYKGKIIILPMTVDVERFKNVNLTNDNNYITYIGNLYNKKDGIQDLIKAFYLLIKNNKLIDKSNIKLRLIGDISNKELISPILELIKYYDLSERVIFTGLINRDNVPFYLKNSKLLVLCRPKTIQNQGGFPTKLGEYLASQVPIVITNVGEIGYYLKDNFHAFISEPDNPEMFAQKMEEALLNEKKAKKIAENGYNLAINFFNYKIQCGYLNNFLQNFNTI